MRLPEATIPQVELSYWVSDGNASRADVADAARVDRDHEEVLRGRKRQRERAVANGRARVGYHLGTIEAEKSALEVDRAGFEPATPAFSVRCSTN